VLRKPALILSILILLAGLALSAGVAQLRGLVGRFPRPEAGDTLSVGGVLWRRGFGWDFSRGACPDGWGWGEWRLRQGILQGHGTARQDAVYICPFDHGGDFLLQTEVRLVQAEGGREVEAHLLTRDSSELHHESGVALIAGAPQGRLGVRHMENRQEHLGRMVRLSRPVLYGDWHRLEFAVRAGEVFVWLDGEPVFASHASWPTGIYGEPHLAVENGVAQFRYLNIYTPA